MMMTAAVHLACNVVVNQFVARPIGTYMLTVAGRPTPKNRKVEKFAQSLMEFWTYTIYFLLGCAVLWDVEWLWPSAMWWKDHRDISPGESNQVGQLNYELRFFYVLYCARYVQGLFSVVFLEHHRSDFLEMVLHHLITSILIILSYSSDYVRIGYMVMVLLDVGDPPLHVAKMCKYIFEAGGPNKKIWSIVADVAFGTFAVIFTVTRLFMFGYMVWSATVELYSVNMDLPWVASVKQVGYRPVCCWMMLWVLLALQVFWEIALCRAIYRVVVLKQLDDPRSDGDSDYDESKKKK